MTLHPAQFLAAPADRHGLSCCSRKHVILPSQHRLIHSMASSVTHRPQTPLKCTWADQGSKCSLRLLGQVVGKWCTGGPGQEA
eukprot:15174236-Alexandrium_andersonii.AAC.1